MDTLIYLLTAGLLGTIVISFRIMHHLAKEIADLTKKFAPETKRALPAFIISSV